MFHLNTTRVIIGVIVIVMLRTWEQVGMSIRWWLELNQQSQVYFATDVDYVTTPLFKRWLKDGVFTKYYVLNLSGYNINLLLQTVCIFMYSKIKTIQN